MTISPDLHAEALHRIERLEEELRDMARERDLLQTVVDDYGIVARKMQDVYRLAQSLPPNLLATPCRCADLPEDLRPCEPCFTRLSLEATR